MTLYGRNKKGKFSEPLSRSKEPWERGRGAPKKGNPSYTPATNSAGRKYYAVRKEQSKSSLSSLRRILGGR